jgi:hypothetical protein
MFSGFPLAFVLFEIVRHTPGYVWVILATLVVLGSLQLRDHHLTRLRLTLAPLALGAFSLWGAGNAFGVHAGVIGAWALGMAAAFMANRVLQWPREVCSDGAGFVVRGSAWPLALMLAIFVLRYVVAVTLVFHRDWATDALFGGILAASYGALSGLFAARAWRILQSASRGTYAAA